VREIDVEELEALLADGVTLVDVREPAEFAEAHVPGAALIPIAELAAHIGDFDKNEPVYLICRSGHRSAVMCELLDRAGFDAVNVAGGTLAWVRAGKPYDQGM
jgi:rhodanese-related sulfurtransferase